MGARAVEQILDEGFFLLKKRVLRIKQCERREPARDGLLVARGATNRQCQRLPLQVTAPGPVINDAGVGLIVVRQVGRR